MVALTTGGVLCSAWRSWRTAASGTLTSLKNRSHTADVICCIGGFASAEAVYTPGTSNKASASSVIWLKTRRRCPLPCLAVVTITTLHWKMVLNCPRVGMLPVRTASLMNCDMNRVFEPHCGARPSCVSPSTLAGGSLVGALDSGVVVGAVTSASSRPWKA